MSSKQIFALNLNKILLWTWLLVGDERIKSQRDTSEQSKLQGYKKQQYFFKEF